MRHQPPIADYAMLGDGHTAALVSRDGSIDWLPWPDFDSPTIFGALLDRERGGRFAVGCPGPGAARRRYVEGTNVLETFFDSPTGSATVVDFLAVEPMAPAHHMAKRRALVRLMHGVAGTIQLSVSCRPRPMYGAKAPGFERISDRTVLIRGAERPMVLHASAPISIAEGALGTRMHLARGDDGWAVLTDEDAEVPDGLSYGRELLDDTVMFWREWLSHLVYDGPFRGHVERSALTLKALIYAPTGAIIAAPTASLPEQPGGERNWDYRFAWVRDATLTLAALHGIGYHEEARRFFRFLFDTARGRDPSTLRTLYTIHGGDHTDERELPWLGGYRGARPVRVGNAAVDQLQLDVYGELVDALYTFRDVIATQHEDVTACFAAVDWVADNWRRPDSGIWEMRSAEKSFVHSRAMCWVALDRGIRLANLLLSPTAGERELAAEAARWVASGVRPDTPRWQRERDAIHDEVLARGWDPQIGAFVQAYESRVLDASLLRLPLIGFLPPDDARMAATVERIRRDLTSYGMVHRYRDVDDGLPLGEATFALCTAWLVEVLQMQERHEEATDLFRLLLSYSNDVGLFAEEIDPATSQLWGNFPQAFTHLGVLRAAVRLQKGYLRPHGEGTGPADALGRPHAEFEPGTWGIT